MTNTTYIVYIDQNYQTLGLEANQSDLDRYAENLASHLSKKFNKNIIVEQCLGGERAGRKCLADDDINNYVRELESGDGWIELL